MLEKLFCCGSELSNPNEETCLKRKQVIRTHTKELKARLKLTSIDTKEVGISTILVKIQVSKGHLSSHLDFIYVQEQREDGLADPIKESFKYELEC